MRRSRVSVVAFSLLLAGLCAAPEASRAAGAARAYRNDAMRVRAFQPPLGWERAPQVSYPRLLASYSNPEGGRITLSAAKVAPGDTAERLAENGRAGLAKEGFSAFILAPDGDRVRLSAHQTLGKRTLAQLYLVDGDLGYVVTLVAPDDVAHRMLSDFDSAVRSLQLGPAPSASGAPR